MSVNRKCVQCGKIFTLNDSEIDFYNSKNLSLPKRCKACREINKGKKAGYNRYTKRTKASEKVSAPTASVVGFLVLFLLLKLNIPVTTAFIVSLVSAVVSAVLIYLFAGRKIEIEEFDTAPYTYTFYDTASMVAHYVKHGKEVGCDSMENYLYKANSVIENPKALKKIQKEDGDTAYFYPPTGDFAVVAKAGYIRTYFRADLHYFNKR